MGLKANPRACRYFEQLAPSYRRAYTGWIDSAKRQETREERLREALTFGRPEKTRFEVTKLGQTRKTRHVSTTSACVTMDARMLPACWNALP
ncbi:MAG: YdeI/OmpD-associated family protein [Bryobacterales bacterium]|nr:YdeI/OmpD-associated family protein [Bryobacterales bacterium]